ncbi:MAG: DUF742 domain-containing protein [Catenulispora sp.]|nr:DUF742 domain-containing protein [Catenulispora sp.]
MTRTYVITQGRSGAGPKRRFDLVTLIVAVVPTEPAVPPGPSRPAPGSVADFYSAPGPMPGPTPGPRPPALSPMPEHRAILALCRRPLSVAEIAAHLRLPFSAAAVLVGDLVDAGLAVERRPARAAAVDAALLREVINGLQRL